MFAGCKDAMKRVIGILAYVLTAAFFSVSCHEGGGRKDDISSSSCKYARYFDISCSDGCVEIITLSPYDGRRDTVKIRQPMDNIICMSSSHIAALSSVGADSVITAVSGLRYVTDSRLHERLRGNEVYDIGHESYPDYERIVALQPDLLVTYTVSGSQPQSVSKLRSLGIKVLVLHDHLESHPLARAEYMRLFGALTGRLHIADTVFSGIEKRYLSLCQKADCQPLKALLNIPYGGVWYIPGEENYLSRLIRDAGGMVLGALPGTSRSQVMTIEDAYELSMKADIWLNPGNCRTIEELAAFHQLFPCFGPLYEDKPIYNNTLRTNPEGGNDFYESGAMRPDLVLADLIEIFNACRTGVPVTSELNYFIQLN